MAKKLTGDIGYNDDYQILAIVSHLKDYTLCYHINLNLSLDLIKYDDLVFKLPKNNETGFSWYFYSDLACDTSYYLLGNRGEGNLLIPYQKTVDYFLLIKNPMNSELVADITSRLRKTQNISAVFGLDVKKMKNIDSLLETIELHELEHVIRNSQ